jgi:hypothetical protein
MLNPSTWAEQVRVCGGATAGGGCGGDQVCVPRAEGAYAGAVCIAQDAAVECPAGWGEARVVYTGGSDTRACTDCDCAPQGATCSGGSYTIHDFDDCSGSSATVSGNACVSATALIDFGTWSVRATLPSAQGGACAASGGAPVGGVEVEGARTICCK